jgi:hypothetical protein
VGGSEHVGQSARRAAAANMTVMKSRDREIEEHRSLVIPPDRFEEGFGWTTLLGILFCGLVMMPGGIYLGLITGTGIGSAASWVTVILFMEIARRALKPLSKQNLIVLLHAANLMVAGTLLFPGGPFGQLVFRAYLAGSEAVRDAGMLGAFPSWFAPAPDSAAIVERSLLHRDWLVPGAIVLFIAVIMVLQRYTLGYFFFRLTSDVERLPFPLASVAALGASALAEDDRASAPAPKPDEPKPSEPKPDAPKPSEPKPSEPKPGEPKPGERKRVFSVGAVLGLVYGALLVGVPSVSSLFLTQPLYILPLPFVDSTTMTESVLPSTPTGATLDLAVVLLGFVLPFWTVVGTFVAILATLILNPILHRFGILHTWQPGMDTVNTAFSNNIDFWLSFGIGAGLGVGAVSLFNTLRDIRKTLVELRSHPDTSSEAGPLRRLFRPPNPTRGDYPIWAALAIYVLTAVAVVGLCLVLLPRTPGIVFFLFFFTFIYSPFISYVNARLLGMQGQTVELPFVKEGAFLLSGAKGISIWLAPLPLEHHAWQTQSFRTNELAGVRFWSLLKAELVALPVLFALSLAFWAFIWKADAVPSAIFPWAQINWELHAKNSVLLYSSTFVPSGAEGAFGGIGSSEFMKAIHPGVIAAGFSGTVLAFVATALLGVPVLFCYGLFRGFGQLPHYMLLEIIGALWARRWLNKKFGKERFQHAAPILLAGYLTGVGLIGMATIALRLIKSAVSSAPF